METFIHKLGGGQIIGIEPAVGSDCLLDQRSSVEGRTFVSCESELFESAVESSSIVTSHVERSVITGSHVARGRVSGSILENVVVRGTGSTNATVSDVCLSGGVVVEGCKLRGPWSLHGPYFIHTSFDRQPRHYHLTEGGISLGIIECQPGLAHCGCECRPIDEWIRKKELLRKIFVRRGWPSGAIDLIHQLFEEWR